MLVHKHVGLLLLSCWFFSLQGGYISHCLLHTGCIFSCRHIQYDKIKHNVHLQRLDLLRRVRVEGIPYSPLLPGLTVLAIAFRGLAKKQKFQKSEITMEVGGWVQVSLGICIFFKSSQNSPKPVLIFWSSIPCMLLKVVGYYDLSVMSMSVLGFPKQSLDGGGWVEWALSNFFWIFGMFLTLQSPLFLTTYNVRSCRGS